MVLCRLEMHGMGKFCALYISVTNDDAVLVALTIASHWILRKTIGGTLSWNIVVVEASLDRVPIGKRSVQRATCVLPRTSLRLVLDVLTSLYHYINLIGIALEFNSV